MPQITERDLLLYEFRDNIATLNNFEKKYVAKINYICVGNKGNLKRWKSDTSKLINILRIKKAYIIKSDRCEKNEKSR